ncbi:helix-turn-helix domain-containing protein [Actinoplanes sp. NPDC089786]|uniref:helix-turn-helix domain-containing protein n=1 Tax=Actinoplanes sp. NPDC089786 TaxID=3155185 RepID=UPI0034287191
MTTPPTATGEARKPRKQLTGAARESLTTYATAAYQRGDSIRTIAATTRRSYANIHAILTDAGVTFRPRGGTPSRPAGHPGPTTVAASAPKESRR